MMHEFMNLWCEMDCFILFSCKINMYAAMHQAFNKFLILRRAANIDFPRDQDHQKLI